MNSIEIISVEHLGKGKYKVVFDSGDILYLYRNEMHTFSIEEGSYISIESYNQLLSETVGKRAKKRAMHLLEQMDRTEKQLREKLLSNDYPEKCIEEAIEYVKSFHYLDDYRYACNYIRYSGQKLSRGQVMQKLLMKGISKELIENAIEEEYQADELEQIQKLLVKKDFVSKQNDQKEVRKIYQFLLRRGFSSSDILKAMKS